MVSAAKQYDMELEVRMLNGLLDVMVHLYPESSEKFEYEDEIFALILVTQGLARRLREEIELGKSKL
jgi:hypothetical protein